MRRRILELFSTQHPIFQLKCCGPLAGINRTERGLLERTTSSLISVMAVKSARLIHASVVEAFVPCRAAGTRDQ